MCLCIEVGVGYMSCPRPHTLLGIVIPVVSDAIYAHWLHYIYKYQNLQ